MDYSFLRNVSLLDKSRKRPPKTLNPTEGLVVRIHRAGQVYPSRKLVEKFDLEYKAKGSSNPGFGIDIVDSKEWPVTAQFPRMILFGIVSKDQPKVDLFGTCRYDSAGNPRSNVETQGTTSKELLALVRSMGYLNDDQQYCDLFIRIEHPITTEDGLSYIPKTVTRGERKGENSYERRENVTFYPVDTGEEEEPKKEEATTDTTVEIKEEQMSN